MSLISLHRQLTYARSLVTMAARMLFALEPPVGESYQADVGRPFHRFDVVPYEVYSPHARCGYREGLGPRQHATL